MVESEGIADGEHLLAHQQILGFTDGYGTQSGRRRTDLEDSEILVRSGPDQDRLPGGLVCHGYLDPAGIFDDMEIGDNAPFPVPDKATSRALGDLHRIEGEKIPSEGDGGDIDDRRRVLPEDLYGVLFISRQVAPGSYNAGLSIRVTQAALHG